LPVDNRTEDNIHLEPKHSTLVTCIEGCLTQID